MSIMAAQPATTPIPVQLSETEFTAFILPHLSLPKRGPKCKVGYHRVFNFILWVLYTGMQWKCLPIPQDPNGKPAIHYTTVYNGCSPLRLEPYWLICCCFFVFSDVQAIAFW
jgi:transposase